MKDNQAKYPQLRFKGFTDPWEQRKTKELCDISTGKGNTQDKVEDGKYPFYVRSATIERSNEYLYDQEAVLTVGDGVGTGKVFHYVNGKYNLHQRVYRMFNFNHGVSAKYFYHYFSKNFYRRVMLMTAKTSVDSVRMEMIADMKIKFPSPAEQETIVSVLDGVDDLISLHQRKLAKLKELKQGYLQKLFPKNGAKVPELRFAGFADAWEERKLSDLFIKGGSGGTPKSTNKAFYDGDIPFLGISDITKSNGFINNTEKHISSDGLNSSAAWIVSKGAISLAMYASVGKLAILNIDAATSQAFYNMIFDDYDLRDLVYQRLNKANELSEWNKLISTGTQSNLNADKVKNFQMYLPKNHDEIKLISTFFKQIDNTIVLHQRKLEKLQELKKGYLQKMFC
ncbi:restriction endonuclease subunit S [Pediococcus pentosaceus]|uniref:Restriction endonuclease subunit S n=1 Tax=Pediococcus pentosaceus TaxID=1255 RepID=A0ABQ6XGH2_PEDPE|nr:restriction endonuclease subunit S [Pediococcus pentosaceus]KAF0412299.1 restriction endonuclease subunit S [Pediococcus pentosaceus]KAF0501339.1 restriction endonuclease subunit S [Pediococcus pentosaceus]MBF7138637.1 restriction endonuclease subunit S [Pediococcus pentosaceus]